MGDCSVFNVSTSGRCVHLKWTKGFKSSDSTQGTSLDVVCDNKSANTSKMTKDVFLRLYNSHHDKHFSDIGIGNHTKAQKSQILLSGRRG